MQKGNPRLGKCLCGAEATIRDTKATDGRLHYICRDLTPTGKAKHFGFVDASEASQIEQSEERLWPFVDEKKDPVNERGPVNAEGQPLTEEEQFQQLFEEQR